MLTSTMRAPWLTFLCLASLPSTRPQYGDFMGGEAEATAFEIELDADDQDQIEGAVERITSQIKETITSQLKASRTASKMGLSTSAWATSPS